MTTKKTIKQADMFDINGPDKLSTESVYQREEIIRQYAKDPNTVFYISVSGGKHGQAMSILVRKIVPLAQIVFVHAHLGDAVEHEGIMAHIKETVPAGVPFHVVKNKLRDFIGMVLLRGMFPSPKYRTCTSDLKTNPIDSFIRKDMAERGATVGFNCIGLRSEESVPRSGRNPLFVNNRLTLQSGKRTVYDFLPAFHLTEKEVFETIYGAGEKPFGVYGTEQDTKGDVVLSTSGNTRVSCKFCIMGNVRDLRNAATWYPDRYAQMIALERVIGHTMFIKTVKKEVVPVPLEDKVGLPFDEIAVRRWMMVLNNQRQALLKDKEDREAEKLANREAKKAEAAKKKVSKKYGSSEDNLTLAI